MSKPRVVILLTDAEFSIESDIEIDLHVLDFSGDSPTYNTYQPKTKTLKQLDLFLNRWITKSKKK